MSKPQIEKVVIDFNDEQLLADLGFDEDTVKYRKEHEKEKEYAAKAAVHTNNKKRIAIGLMAAVEAVGADSVTYTKGKKTYTVTISKGEPGEKLNPDKLRDNLMVLGKLNAELITKIIQLSTDRTEPRASYPLVTVSGE